MRAPAAFVTEQVTVPSLGKGLSGLCLGEVEARQSFDNGLRLHRDGDDGEEQVEDVAWLVVFKRPVIGVVLDEVVLVDRHSISLHNPFDRRLAVDYILVSLGRDMLFSSKASAGGTCQEYP